MNVLRVTGGMLAATAVTAVMFIIGSAGAGAQSTGAASAARDWSTYGGNLASHRYSPADQITKDNFNKLEIAWRLKTDFLGPRPDTLYSATPLVVDRVRPAKAGHHVRLRKPPRASRVRT